MPRNHNTATATPEVHAQPQVPEFYGFTDAFDETGMDLENIIQSRITNVPPKVNYGQAEKMVRSPLNRYTKFGERVFQGVRASNYNHPVTPPGHDIDSLNTADKALPGTKEYMRLVRRKLDGHIEEDFVGDTMVATAEEELFLEAMKWSAQRELRNASPKEITPAEYSSDMFNPHKFPYDTYEHAQEAAFNNMLIEATQQQDEARAQGNNDLVARHQQTIDDLILYSEAYLTTPPAHLTNKGAARTVGEQLNNSTDEKPGPVDAAALQEMKDQTELDRVLATYDGQLKNRMKAELDSRDNYELAKLQNMTNVAQDNLAKESAGRMRRMIPVRSAKLKGQADYDNASAFLGAMELRMAQRIGIPNMDGGHDKIAGNGMQADALMATNHLDRAKALDAKILRNLDTRTKGDMVADFWAGKNKGEKETRKAVNFSRRALKVGLFAGMSVLGGPAGFAAGMGLLKAGGKMAEYTSKHANELRKRDMDSITDMRDLMDIMDQKNAPAIYKVFGSRKLERSSRNKDMLAQQTRMILAYGKTALWGAGVGFAPYYGPTLAHIGLDVAEQGWELTKGTYNRF